ncbi:hypothetical protein J6TS1_20680 [Siminovitchia terrae]|uniref:LTA synthase family protein n=1 Tax=Siminovitchia terrae TaxID=1914933 RepID=A0ABQ4KVY4_SIMTE|nr:hypothetical protein J22TS1_37180 [Siminovitchia terrae]GIN96198.1 hypothetical protein J6TS1_20680 [Siminovitchia terrae]
MKFNSNKQFFLKISIHSLLMFCLLVILNRFIIVLENPDFIAFHESNLAIEWIKVNGIFINIVLFTPLVLSITFFLVFLNSNDKSRE